jgi:hypothetical protein
MPHNPANIHIYLEKSKNATEFYDDKKAGKQTEIFIYGALALLFQPFFKIAFRRQLWNAVDEVVGIGLTIPLL